MYVKLLNENGEVSFFFFFLLLYNGCLPPRAVFFVPSEDVGLCVWGQRALYGAGNAVGICCCFFF
jgi:hypothetical protein